MTSPLPTDSSAAKIAFLFKGGRKSRLDNPDVTPTEFFYGYPQLAAKGLDVTLLESSEFGIHERIPRLWSAVSTVMYKMSRIHMFVLWRFIKPGSLKRFSQFDAIVVTTTVFGLVLAMLKALGLLKPTVYFIVMGVLDFSNAPLKRRLVTYLMGKTEVITISKGEKAIIQDAMGEDATIHYIPFGVDHNFWTPKAPSLSTSSERAFVLSIGNDLKRDYATLLEAWKPEYPTLKIITSLNINSDKPNIVIERGNWNQLLKTDDEIRELFREALFVILPIRQTSQPSGQSACLQAMACAKRVILSKTQGLWDEELMVSGTNCLLIEPESIPSLQRSVETFIQDHDMSPEIGLNARSSVENHLNVDVMASALLRIINSTAGCTSA